MLQQIFITIFEVSIASSLIIMVVKLFSTTINQRYETKWKYWIWLLIGIRLVIPFNIAMPQFAVELDLPDVALSELQHGQAQPVMPPFADELLGGGAVTVMEAVMVLWLVGVCVFLVYHMLCYISVKKRIMQWAKPASEEICAQIKTLGDKMGIKRNVSVLICDSISSPLMIGFLKPYMVLPFEGYENIRLDLIVMHELTHYKRRDLWYKAFITFTNALHWFNPFVYILAYEANADLELSCDGKVVAGISYEEKVVYSDTILASINQQRMKQAMFTSYFYSGTGVMKERFKNILAIQKKHNAVHIVAITLVLLIFAGSLFSVNLIGYAMNQDGPGLWERQFDHVFSEMAFFDMGKGIKNIYDDPAFIHTVGQEMKKLSIVRRTEPETVNLSNISYYFVFSGENEDIIVSLPYLFINDEAGALHAYQIYGAENMAQFINDIFAVTDTDAPQAATYEISTLDRMLLQNYTNEITEEALPDRGEAFAPAETPATEMMDAANEMEREEQPEQLPQQDMDAPEGQKTDEEPMNVTPSMNRPPPVEEKIPALQPADTETPAPSTPAPLSRAPEIIRYEAEGIYDNIMAEVGETVSFSIETNEAVESVSILVAINSDAGGAVSDAYLIDDFEEAFHGDSVSRIWKKDCEVLYSGAYQYTLQANGSDNIWISESFAAQSAVVPAPEIMDAYVDLEVMAFDGANTLYIETNQAVTEIKLAGQQAMLKYKTPKYEERTGESGIIRCWAIEFYCYEHTGQLDVKITAFDAHGESTAAAAATKIETPAHLVEPPVILDRQGAYIDQGICYLSFSTNSATSKIEVVLDGRYHTFYADQDAWDLGGNRLKWDIQITLDETVFDIPLAVNIYAYNDNMEYDHLNQTLFSD